MGGGWEGGGWEGKKREGEKPGREEEKGRALFQRSPSPEPKEALQALRCAFAG